MKTEQVHCPIHRHKTLVSSSNVPVVLVVLVVVLEVVLEVVLAVVLVVVFVVLLL